MNLSKVIELDRLFANHEQIIFDRHRRCFRAGEKAQHLRALDALPGVLSSIPRKHKVYHYHLSWDAMLSPAVSEDGDTYMK